MNKGDFFNYMDKSTLSKNKVVNYIEALDKVFEVFNPSVIPEKYKSAYSINNVNTFIEIFQNIKNHPDFNDWNFHKDKNGNQDGNNGNPKAALIQYLNFLKENKKDVNEINKKEKYNNRIKESRNLIYYGASGTGKSYQLQENIPLIIPEEKKFLYCDTVTFYSDYTYKEFIGSYKVENDKNGYSFTYEPGVFMKVLQKAYTDPHHKYLLVIENLNSADADKVFGDALQLLDRNADYSGKYSIRVSKEIVKYMDVVYETGIGNTISIPENMYIWATMTSGLKSGYDIDGSFFRCWDLLYFGIDEGEEYISDFEFYAGERDNRPINWNKLRKAINNKLLYYDDIIEDRLITPFFVPKVILDREDNDGFLNIFKNKILLYLFYDVAKKHINDLFSSSDNLSKRSFSNLCKEFDKKGIEIFSPDIVSKVIND